MSTAASSVLDYLVKTSFPTALSTYTDPVTGSAATIYFGPGMEKFEAQVALQVHGIKFDDTWAEIGPNYRYEETAEIPCTLTSWNPGEGDTQGFLDRKSECFAALSLITINIANDVTLGGLVRWCRFQLGQFMPATPNTGSLGHLDFTIGYRVRVNSLDAGQNHF